MHKIAGILLFGIALTGDPGYSEEARNQFRKGNYQKSLVAFAKAEKQLPEFVRIIEYNIGQCYLQIEDKNAATEAFRNALDKPSRELNSRALNNIGLLQIHEEIDSMAKNNNRVDFEPALESLRDALRENPGNETARKNYEILKKIYEKLKEQQQDQQNEGGQSMMVLPPPPDMQPPENPSPDLPQNMLPPENSTGEYGDLSMDEARKKLDEMRNKENQFLQQLRKKNKNEKKEKRDQDW